MVRVRVQLRVEVGKAGASLATSESTFSRTATRTRSSDRNDEPGRAPAPLARSRWLSLTRRCDLGWCRGFYVGFELWAEAAAMPTLAHGCMETPGSKPPVENRSPGLEHGSDHSYPIE